ncbi:MAG TPA: cysteine--tRNA ligase [Candidatus Azosocius sp. HAIN]
MLKIYNTLSQKKELIKFNFFCSLKIYVCGVTVYDYCHVGHSRIFIFFDFIIKYLRYLGCNVYYVRNVTDIDDKIILKSKKLCISFSKIVFYFINFMKQDFNNLNLLFPTYEPKATYFVNSIVNLIFFLNKNGFSYKSKIGDLYYFVNKYLKYGNISNRNIFCDFTIDRKNLYIYKNFLYDFVLWKVSNIFKPFWNCSLGYGRPGWHIECSTMSMYYFGDSFDIHGGGLDLMFPHHENECAQSESLTKKLFANIWMHIGFVEINNFKMSKSFKNYISIKSLLNNYDSETIRYFILSVNYRSPLCFCFNKLNLSKKMLIKFYSLFIYKYKNIFLSKNNIFEKRFYFFMNNDFNTVEIFSILFDLFYEIIKIKNISLYKFLSLIRLLKILGKSIGFFYFDTGIFLNNLSNKINKCLSDENIKKLVFYRYKAKTDFKWNKSDFIKKYLFNFRIYLQDVKKNNTIWNKL